MRRIGLVVLLLGTALSALAQPYHRRTGITEAIQPLSLLYDKAIYDSSVYRAANLRELRPLVADANGEVLVATLTRLDGAVGSTITSKNDGIWVTGVPEVRDKCRTWTGDVVMKLRMLIGLPPDADVPRMLVLRAKLADIFRPSPYADPTTSWPCPTKGSDGCGNVFPSTTTQFHYQWMASEGFVLHELPGGYPWTHLGYTYNWAPAEDRYGASEYVIAAGATATIVENTTPVAYCAPAVTAPPAPSR
jgi:hypothetical protein